MAVATPDTAKQVEDRMKADVQREAPDSNPYLSVHWLRSLIAGVARRVFDFYQDLRRTEARLFPDTADGETAPRWGGIFVGAKNPASRASGTAIATGTLAAVVPDATSLTIGAAVYETVGAAVLQNNSLVVASLTRVGALATVQTSVNHGLASFNTVTLAGFDQTEYNLADTEITVIAADVFTFAVAGVPATPATGSGTVNFVGVSVAVQSTSFGADTNQSVNSPLALGSPLVGVDDTLYVDFGELSGGSDEESTNEYKTRYLERLRNPVTHFNVSDIVQEAKTVPGVTRVFVEPSGTVTGQVSVSSITRNGNIATATTSVAHGLVSGQIVTVSGADQLAYNLADTRVLVESPTVFSYVALGSPVTPATGTITVGTGVPPGQVKTFFMRDNDVDPIPSVSEVAAVKAVLDAIMPANTQTLDNIVEAPAAVVVNYTFTQLTPDTLTMRDAVTANIQQFHEEQTTVGANLDGDAYRAAIKNTIDPATGDTVSTFELSAPLGDVTILSGQIAVAGAVAFP